MVEKKSVQTWAFTDCGLAVVRGLAPLTLYQGMHNLPVTLIINITVQIAGQRTDLTVTTAEPDQPGHHHHHHHHHAAGKAKGMAGGKEKGKGKGKEMGKVRSTVKVQALGKRKGPAGKRGGSESSGMYYVLVIHMIFH